MSTNDPGRRFGFYLLPNFSMLAFTSALEPLRSANRVRQEPLYSWRLYTIGGEPVTASNGITLLPDATVGDDHWPEVLFVCAGIDAERHEERQLNNWLRTLSSRGAALGSISTGGHILARAGLLKGYRSTIHWEALPSFAEIYPELEVTQNVFEIDRDRYSCSGGTAGLDMMLSLITEDHGPELAALVADQFIIDRVRSAGDHQRMAEQMLLASRAPKLAAASEIMVNNLENPFSPAEVAAKVGLSLRQLERLFHQYRGRTPQRYYLDLRLRHARLLLLQTRLSVLDVSLAAGFGSQSHFTKSYREFFGCTPKDERTAGLKQFAGNH